VFIRACGFVFVIVWVLLGLTWLWAPIYFESEQSVQQTILSVQPRLAVNVGSREATDTAAHLNRSDVFASSETVQLADAAENQEFSENSRNPKASTQPKREASVPSPALTTQLRTTATQTIGVELPGGGEIIDRDRLKSVAVNTTKEVVIERGDTLVELLRSETLSYGEAISVIQALSKLYDPRRLQIGQKLWLTFRVQGTSRRLEQLEFVPAVDRRIQVALSDDGTYAASEVAKQLRREYAAAAGVISSSLFAAGEDAEVPLEILVRLLKLYAYDVDFQRDIQTGDAFEVLYERYVTNSGELARVGDIHYATLVLGGQAKTVFRFKHPDGTSHYYDETGRSVRKALLRTPVDGARISSRYGMRRHPVLGYSKMHKGVDFSAPTGTPIYAAGDGVIAEIGRKGSYGHYIQIRHNDRISTAYAHMSRYARGLRRGDRVTQGQVIGYVGSTGRSTGPHLHYEVLRSGRPINPMSIKQMGADRLRGAELRSFQRSAEGLRARFAELTTPVQVAQVVDSVGEAAAE